MLFFRVKESVVSWENFNQQEADQAPQLPLQLPALSHQRMSDEKYKLMIDKKQVKPGWFTNFIFLSSKKKIII